MARKFIPDQALYNDDSVLNAANPFPVTFAGWSNRDNNNTGAFISIGNTAQDRNFMLVGYIAYTMNSLWCLTRGENFNDFSVVSTVSSNPNTWVHFAAVLPDAATIVLYVDGQTGQYIESSGPNFFDPFNRIGIGYIPRLTTGLAQFFEGLLAEWGMWNVALSQAEIQALAKGVSPLFIRPQNLLMYIPLIRDNDNDLVGGLNFSALGVPTIAEHPRIITPGVYFLGAPAPVDFFQEKLIFNSRIKKELIFESRLQQ